MKKVILCIIFIIVLLSGCKKIRPVTVLCEKFESNAVMSVCDTEYCYKCCYDGRGNISMISTSPELVPDINITSDGSFYCYDGINYPVPNNLFSPAVILSKGVKDMKNVDITPNSAGEYLYYGNAFGIDYKAYFYNDGKISKFVTDNIDIQFK